MSPSPSLLPGIDIPSFVNPHRPDNDLDPVQEIAKAVAGSDACVVIEQLAQIDPKDVSEEERQLISSQLLLNFNSKIAAALDAKGLLDYQTVLKNITIQSDCLSWILETPQRVARCEKEVGTGGAGFGEKMYKKANLRGYLTRLAKAHLRTVIDALMLSDLPSIVSDHESLLLDWGKKSTSNFYEADHLHHLGMDVLARAINHPQYDQVGPSRLARLAERMLSEPVLSAAYGKENLTDELFCIQLDPLLHQVLNIHSGIEYGDGKSQLSQLNDILSASEPLSRRQKQYWTFSGLRGKATNFRKGKFNYQARGFGQAVPDTHPQLFLGALFLSGSPSATSLLLDPGPNGQAAWQAIRQGNNLAAYISSASSPDLRKVFPMLIENLGYDFQDGFGNNLAHLLVICPRSPQRQLLNKLISSAHSFDLFHNKNAKGQTPIEAFKTSSCWAKDRYFGSELQKRIQSSRPKRVRQALREMTREDLAKKAQSARPKM